MKVYVDKIPNKCEDCVFSETGFVWDNEVRFCKLKPRCMNWIALYDDKRDDCTLCSIADYTKQVRKEVLADLKEKYKQKMANALGDDEEIGHINCDAVLEELLEEIGFDEVLELYRSQGKWYA